jgi:RHS repeat-associated protein
MRLLSETKGASISFYVYEYNSYVPLARLDSWNREFFAAHGRIPPDSLTRVYYFHCNASGMPEEMTDTEGNIVWRARYAVWGNLSLENVTRHAPSGFEQNLRMQGQYHDRETGLCYNTFRYYDPDVGRFTTEDPIGLPGGLNLYQYAPNPLMWIDPWGWCKQLRNARKAAVGKAWKQEKELVKSTGEGTRWWSPAQKQELLATGKVKRFEGHHINSAKGHPELAANPDNVKFVNGRAEHLAEHGGNFRNQTTGDLLKRSEKLAKAKDALSP